ncbi:putative calcium-binding protein CML27-like, partial [Trifolium pratense]
NLSEFASFCRAGSVDGDASELREAFDLYDKDKNGLISATELFQVLNSLISATELHAIQYKP